MSGADEGDDATGDDGAAGGQVGPRDRPDACRDTARLNAELMRINNETTNALRAAARQVATTVRERPTPAGATDAGRAAPTAREERDDALFSELTAVNNELANLQRELARKNAQLEQLVRERDALLGMAAHDLRTPLGIVLAYSDFLATEGALTEEQRSFVATITDTSRFMLTLIDDLLTVTAIESGQLRLALEPRDVGALVGDNVALTRVLAARKAIAIALDAPDRGPFAEVDQGKLQQVLNNLLTNAIKFSPRGATIRVTVVRVPGDVGDELAIAVTDEGRGIAEADLGKIFKPFGRKRRGTEGEEGTGLGLSISRRIVEGHGGHIGVTSALGQGTTFTVTLPAIAEHR